MNGTAEHHYQQLSVAEIAGHLEVAYDRAAKDAYFLLWVTPPLLHEWMRASQGLRWTYKSGGAWAKTGRMGIGFHWRGDAEFLLMYTKGSPRPLAKNLSNLHIGPRRQHSQKPAVWLEQLITALVSENDLVMDLYAGLAPLARACAVTGHRYVGAEIDQARFDEAMGQLEAVGYVNSPRTGSSAWHQPSLFD